MAEDNPAIWNSATTLQKEDYFNRYLDGKKAPEDAKAEPELQKLLTKLYERQRLEEYTMLDKATGRLSPDGEDRKTNLMHKEEFREDFSKQCLRFAQERDRYIRDYHNAKTIREDMERRERAQTLDDTPKRTR